MLPEKIQEYFSFTKKERIGILVLIALILIIFILPWFFSSPKNRISQQSLLQLKNEVVQLKTRQGSDSFHIHNSQYIEDDDHNTVDYGLSKENKSREKISMFYFDPNSISPGEWKRLGLREKAIQTIRNYLAKGGKFRVPEDLQKIYGLHETEYQRLLPYVRIQNAKISFPSLRNAHSPGSFEKKDIHSFSNSSIYKRNNFKIIDINTADTTAFIALPGIGSKLAARIVNFREKLGGFYTVDQVAETYGLPDSTFQKIKFFFEITQYQLRKLNINTADVNTLKQHPYLKWNVANAIIEYRKQHGEFKALDELKQILLISADLFQKIVPYLTIGKDI